MTLGEKKTTTELDFVVVFIANNSRKEINPRQV